MHMDFKDLVQARYSVRSYLERPIDEEKLNLVLEAARLAPTAANHQPFQLIVVRDETTKEALGAAYARRWFWNAPVIIVACGVPSEAWVREDGFSSLEIDIAIVVDHLILQATELGLGTCWIANFKPEVVREVLDLAPDLVPVILVPLGFRGDQPSVKRRRELASLVRYHEAT
jgi:nitroreductase